MNQIVLNIFLETQKRLLSKNSLTSADGREYIAKKVRKQDNCWMDTGFDNNDGLNKELKFEKRL